MFHGNAGNIGHRLPVAKMLERHTNCNVLMLEYRGYGLSTGTPDEEGLNMDAQTGLDWIRKNEETKKGSVIVFGQSLGGAVAINLVKRNQGDGDVIALVLENTFLSMRKMIPAYVLASRTLEVLADDKNRAFPPARYLAPLCHQVWDSETVLPGIKDMPILFLSGLKDEIVP